MTEWAKPFGVLTKKTHTQQAIWWLNGFWAEGAEEQQETIWEFAHMFIEIQTGKPILYGSKKSQMDEKCDLDEMQAHRFLEKIGETLTVKQLRAKLSKLDIDSNNRLALSEYLLSKYDKSPAALVDSNQGGVPPEVMDEAQAKVDAASDALNTASEADTQAKESLALSRKAGAEAATALALAEKSAEEAKVALENSENAAAEAAKSLGLAEKAAAEADEATKKQEEVLKSAQKCKDEVQAGAEALEQQEKEYNDKIVKLESRANDSKLSTVKRGSYVAKLAALKSEDPLPLRKAKITQNAALKKQKKFTKKVQKATEKTREMKAEADTAAAASAEAKNQADAAAVASAKAKEEADADAAASAEAKNQADAATKVAEEAEQKAIAAVEAAVQAFDDANQTLQDLKNDDSPPNGAIWWMSRVMKEKEKFMPKRRKKKK